MILEKQEVDLLAELFGGYIHSKLQRLEELSDPFSNKQTIHFIDKARTILCQIDLVMKLVEKIMQEVQIDNRNSESEGRGREDDPHN